MKISLKLFIVIICTAIVGMLAYQFYWLHSLYNSTQRELDSNIKQAMTVADMNEVQVRLGILEKGSNRYSRIISSVGFSSDNKEIMTSLLMTKETKNERISTVYSAFYDTVRFEDSKILKGSILTSVVINGIHQNIDESIFPDVQRYDSLLSNELLSLGIENKFYVDLVKNSSDSLISSSLKNKPLTSLSDLKSYNYTFGAKNAYVYRLWIDNPSNMIVKQMAWIFAVSFFVLLLLACLFYLLMRTIWKQKTLEEMKNDFINNMTHELKTPLSVSYAAIDSLLVTEKANDKEHRDKYLTIAKDQISHLTGLAEQILSMSRDSKRNVELHPEEIKLKEMLESIIRQQALTAKKNIEFETQIDPDGMIIVFDRMHLANILNNLIENSIKYSNSSVHILIEAYFVNGKDIEISIKDNGIGIDSERQKHIFDKFYRVPTGDKYNVKGYGLGLFYVKEILGRVGGSIYVKSKFGKGSVFTIHLPQ